jgi:diadenosine tetraphosphate (Ap4A) HIT family hydrolase
MNFFDQEEQNHRSQQHQKTTATNGGHNDAEQQKQQKQRRTLKKKGVLYDADTGEVVECLFCKIHQRQEPGRIEYEDEKYVVFHTIDPATHLHLLVTPRQHITSVHSLKGHEGAQLIRELIEIGKRALKEENCSHAKFCFHIPPYTSIDHLHLHAIADHANHASWWYKIKYPTSSNWYCKNAMDLVHELEKQDSSV